ncbi:MAG: selenium-binding protein SBP56-related protein, partial [Pirellula sp.]
MQRRQFSYGLAAGSLLFNSPIRRLYSHEDHVCHATHQTVQDAIQAPAEKFAFVPAILVGTDSNHADYMATVDVDRSSKSYGQVVGRFSLPNSGDELHHYGWNACSSCHGERQRRYLVVPGLSSGNIYAIDASDPVHLKLHKTITRREIVDRTNLSTPHTVHCRADGVIMISMLGDSLGNAPGGFLEIDQEFNVIGRWEKSVAGMHFNYDFWYQPRHNIMISSEWAAPNTVKQGFKLEDVQQAKYGRHLNFWDWSNRQIVQSVDLGESGLIPLEVRFHHNPESTHGFVGAALSSAIHHWYNEGGKWKTEKIIQVDPVETKGWPFPVPGLITDLVLSLDDRFLYFANWLHGDIRQYEVSNPSLPKLSGQIF